MVPLGRVVLQAHLEQLVLLVRQDRWVTVVQPVPVVSPVPVEVPVPVVKQVFQGQLEPLGLLELLVQLARLGQLGLLVPLDPPDSLETLDQLAYPV